MTGAKFIEPPPPSSDWNRRLAGFVLAHQTANPDEVLREWYAALFRNVRHWPTKRESRVVCDPMAAHRECLGFAELNDGQYCEGLIVGPDVSGPEKAIWALLSDRLVCFTHDLSKPHGLHGLAFDHQVLYSLRNGFGITGPYLFSDRPQVMTRCIPRPAPRPYVRPLPYVSMCPPAAMVM